KREEVIEDLLSTLKQHGVEPVGANGAAPSVHTERRIVDTTAKKETEATSEPAQSWESDFDSTRDSIHAPMESGRVSAPTTSENHNSLQPSRDIGSSVVSTSEAGQSLGVVTATGPEVNTNGD